ncbi:MAG: hypothetical protein M0P14_07310 [Alkaliphilus sp.]|nr:hypothetical protein [Alkaliphilus sp.]
MAEQIKMSKGKFKLAGLVNGTGREKFITTKTFDTGTTRQTCNFGVKTSEKNETWVTVEGFDSKKAKFQKYDNKEKKSYTKEVSWDDRFNFQEDGYRPIFGIAVNFEENNYKTLFSFDAVDELETELTDNMPVYIEGNIDYRSWKNDKGEVRRFTTFKPTKIRKSTKDIDFNSDGFEELNLFEQDIIFIDVNPHPEQSDKFILEANVVTGTKAEPKVEDVEFIISDKKLATTLKKNLKPYNAVTVFGRLVNSVQEEDVPKDDDVWGEDDAEFTTASAPRIREMIITKVYKNTIDKTSYSENVISNIKNATDSFGDTEWDDDKGIEDDVWG